MQDNFNKSNVEMGARVVVVVLVALLLMALCLGVAGYTAGATAASDWMFLVSG